MTQSPGDGRPPSGPGQQVPPPFEHGQLPPRADGSPYPPYPPPGPGHGPRPGAGSEPNVEPGHDNGAARSDDDRTWGMLSHLGALLASVASGTLLGLVVPLVILLTKGTTSPYVRRHAAESLNFQLTVLLVAIVGGLLGVIAALLTLGLGLIIIIPAALAYAAFAFVMPIVATVRALRGQTYRYPLNIRFVT